MVNPMRQAPSSRARRFFAATLDITIAFILFLFLAWPQSRLKSDIPAETSDDAMAIHNPFGGVGSFPNSPPVYPYSVVPGGIHSMASLREVVDHDRVAAKHYSNLNLKSAHFVAGPERKYVFVSYRIGNKIFWTRKRVRIPQGEVLITDGSTWIRSRCGNQISETPRNPTSPNEPPIARLETPELFIPPDPVPFDPTAPIILLAESPPPVLLVPPGVPRSVPHIPPVLVSLPVPPRAIPIPPIIVPPTTFTPPVNHPDPPPDVPPVTPLPEPGSLLLLVSGLGCAWFGARCKRR
jgi:hypothetical protein